jgi:hypothetical protein
VVSLLDNLTKPTNCQNEPSSISFDKEGYARPLESFRKRKATILIEYDLSLDSFAVGVSVLNNLTGRYELVGYTVVESSLAVRQDSSYQNTCEYSAVLLGLLMARNLGYKHFSYDLAGDSISSLVWCDKDRVNSSLARAANIGFTLVAVDIDATVADIRHVPGVDNVVWDGLSRSKKGTEVGLDETCLVPSEGLFQQFLALCDPTRALETTPEHTFLTQTLIKLIRSSSTNNKRLIPFPFLRRKEGGEKRVHESLRSSTQSRSSRTHVKRGTTSLPEAVRAPVGQVDGLPRKVP